MNELQTSQCPQCGSPMPPGSTGDVCPRCAVTLLQAEQTKFTGELGPHGTRILQQPPTPAELADKFPQLEVLELLGRGGMGVVYRARQRTLNRVVALKLLAPERVDDPKFAERFVREAQALAALNHPNIVTVYDFGQAGGFYFLLMEFVDGVNLRQALRGGRFTPEQALAIVPPICDALQYAHERGIVHRDIKPENLLLDKGGQVKIADFGIAKILGNDPAATGPADPVVLQQTAAGTPQYMAPEQRDNSRHTDHRADIYSLGVVLYELLTGELPGAKLQPPSRKVQIDVRLDEIVLRALEKEPELRYATADEFKTSIQTVAAPGTESELLSSVPPPSKVSAQRISYLALGLFLAATLGPLLLMTISPQHKLALMFGALVSCLALACGLMSWRRRLGKIVSVAALTIILGLGITVAIRAGVIPWLSEARRRAAVREQGERQAALASAQAIAGREGSRWNDATDSKAGSTRLRFKPREGMADQTSWIVHNKPSAINPDGWAVMARMTLGGEAPVRLARQNSDLFRIALIDGNDDQITVAIREPASPGTIRLELRRDHPVKFAVAGQDYRIVYPSSNVPPDRPNTSPFALVVLTPVLQELPAAPADEGPSPSAQPEARDMRASDPRTIVNQWLAHVKAGRTEEMWSLTTRESGGAGSVDLKNTWQYDKIKAYTLAWNDDLALVGTTRYKDNSGRERMIVFSFVHRDGRWLIREDVVTTPESAESRLEGFTAHPGVRYDVRREDVIGRWTEAFFSPATFRFESDGHFSMNYRVVGGARTNLQGTWRLENDRLNYITAAGSTTGRVVRVREDFFQLEHPDGNQSGFHRVDEAAAARAEALNRGDLPHAFALGHELAALPHEEGLDLLRSHWRNITNADARQQLLKAWVFSSDPTSVDTNSFRLRAHPKLLDVLNLGMRDASGEVQGLALRFLTPIALRDFFYDDFTAYESWHAAYRDRPLADVVNDSLRSFMEDLRKGDTARQRERLVLLKDNGGYLEQLPGLRDAVQKLGLNELLKRLAGDRDEEIAAAASALLSRLGPNGPTPTTSGTP